MRRRIDLLKTQARYLKIENFFRDLKAAIIVLFVVFLAVYIVFFYLLSLQRREISDLSVQKREFLEFFIQNKEVEAKFVYFRNKQKQLNDILKEDVNFYPYYNLLKESLQIANVEARLESVLIDKTKSVGFSLSFTDYSSLLSFLRFAESDEFLKNFNQLDLINFSKDDKQSAKIDYRLNFSGKFINLNEN